MELNTGVWRFGVAKFVVDKMQYFCIMGLSEAGVSWAR